MNIRTFVAILSRNLQYDFPKMRGGGSKAVWKIHLFWRRRLSLRCFIRSPYGALYVHRTQSHPSTYSTTVLHSSMTYYYVIFLFNTFDLFDKLQCRWFSCCFKLALARPFQLVLFWKSAFIIFVIRTHSGLYLPFIHIWTHLLIFGIYPWLSLGSFDKATPSSCPNPISFMLLS